ncbi:MULTISPECIES: sensor histidine kinase [Chitinophagaceae]|uniref:sensor histidine kinase n=1 Tax=Chitinophagaceae TaxID=563835 RepID=UPI001F001904|nr:MULTISPECIES: PAS domain-containing sensor histidine kinase [Chitinophagaceae]
MPQLSSRQATVYALLVFAGTIALSYFYPGYTITLSGLLVVIFLSVFVQSKGATIVAAVVSCAVLLAFMAFNQDHIDITRVWMEFYFMLVLVLFTTLIVLYIKSLIRRMQFDKSHMTSLFENATEGILVTDNRGLIILANPSALRMFAYEPKELLGKPVEVLLPKRYRAGHSQLREGFYQEPQNRTMGSGRDLYGQKQDGSSFPVEVSLSAYKQQNEQYVIAFIVDITHRKEIEQSMLKQQQQLEKVTNDIRRLNAELEAKVEERTVILKEALQRLEQSQEELSEALDKERQLNEIKGRFVSMASHEFRTPLSAVLSSASLLAKYTTSEQQPNRDKHINRIRDSVKHLNDLLEDFLSLGKLDEGKIGAVFLPFHLSDAIGETVEDMKGLLKEGQHIEYHHDGPNDVESDRKLLKNILINLISNALKFSDANATVMVRSNVAAGEARISVTDRGIGISEEDQKHLFTTFFRGKNALNIQGTGLGLHIVKRYADMLQGTLHLQSILNQGTTITLTFPINHNADGKDYFGN